MGKRSTPARNAKGRFVKGGASRRKTTAIVRAAPRTITRTRTRTVALAPRRRRRVGGRGRGGGIVATLKHKAPGLAVAAAYGWVTSADLKSDSFGMTAREWLAKVPTLDSIGKPLSHGILATLIASYTSGRVRHYTDLLATAALYRGAHNFGASGWDLDKTAKLAGDDVSGDFDDDESAGYDEGDDE